MAEVSEQPIQVEKQSVTQKDQQSKEDTTTTSAQQDIKELETIIEELSSLFSLCEKTLTVCADLGHQEDMQRQLKTFSSGLIALPRCLQHLHDFRRLIPDIVVRAQSTRKELIAVRGGEEDALVSEEARILESVEHVKEVILQSIQSLESTLSHVRDTSPPLLAVISYTDPGFEAFAPQALSAIRIDLIAGTLFTERERLKSLRIDIRDVYALKDHVAELS